MKTNSAQIATASKQTIYTNTCNIDILVYYISSHTILYSKSKVFNFFYAIDLNKKIGMNTSVPFVIAQTLTPPIHHLFGNKCNCLHRKVILGKYPFFFSCL